MIFHYNWCYFFRIKWNDSFHVFQFQILLIQLQPNFVSISGNVYLAASMRYNQPFQFRVIKCVMRV